MNRQTINPPDLDDILNELKFEIFAQLNCVQIGKIEKFTSGEQSAEIQIMVKRQKSETEIVSYPVLVDCPVFVLQGGGAYIDMPIAAGDYCIVLFNDRNIDTWWTAAQEAEPATRRKHSLSDGIALVGLNPKTQVLDFDGSLVRILGTSGAGSEAFAARTGDAINSLIADDSTFWTWLAAAAAVLAGLGVVVPIPTSLTGKITGGSTEVKIG